jgi:alpha,alpha-trehalase
MVCRHFLKIHSREAMMKLIYLVFILIPAAVPAQFSASSPAQLYGELFRDVQMSRVFTNSKQFADSEPKLAPEDIVNKYRLLKDSLLKGVPRRLRKKGIPVDAIRQFVAEYFETTPSMNDSSLRGDTSANLEIVIKNLWKSMTYSLPVTKKGSSLIALPHPYVGMGSYLNEMHYWQSYFVMLGLEVSGEEQLLEHMVNNFAYLIDAFGHIPATNRTYSLSFSEPPFFSLMIDLLADIKGDSIYLKYLPYLEKEYLFWMDGADSIKKNTGYKRVVKFDDGTVLNRYGDGLEMPREEFYQEDLQFAENINRAKKDYWLSMRAAYESGWFLSSRWLEDIQKAESVKTSNLLPVDLNSLLLHLEVTLRNIYRRKGETQKVLFYAERILNREVKMDFLFWNKDLAFYCDYDMEKKQASEKLTLAGVFPLLLKDRYRKIDPERVENMVEVLKSHLLFEGGARNTTLTAAQPFWDAPYGSAPLQWALITALENYGYHSLAEKIALDWVNLNLDVYSQIGRLLNHYDVVNTKLKYDFNTQPPTDMACGNGLFLYLVTKYKMRRAGEKK